MFVRTEGPIDAKIMLVGEAPGEDEDRLGRPFVGRAGNTLNSLLGQAGINRAECLIANVAREKPPANQIPFYFHDKNCTIPNPKMIGWMELLKEEIIKYKPNIVVALGNTALWALTGEKGIKAHRGYITESTLVPGQKVLPTYHPQAVGYEWSLAFTVIMDLRKARRHSDFPEIPEEDITIVPDATQAQWVAFCRSLIEKPKPVAVDIETSAPGCHINRIGFADDQIAMSLPILRGRTPVFPEQDELEVWFWTARVLETCPVIMHNASFDSGVLLRNHGIHTRQMEMDTQVAAHVLYVESASHKDKDDKAGNVYYSLGYLSSIFLDTPAWKHTASQDAGMYNARDVGYTRQLRDFFMEELKRQNLLSVFGYEMGQLPVATMMQLQGLNVDVEGLGKFAEDLRVEIKDIKHRLNTMAGKEINYSSPIQVKQLLYDERQLPVQYKRRKSIREERKVTTDEEALEKLARTVSDPIVPLILDYRKKTKMLSSFADVPVSPQGKVHTSYNPTGTSSGRWSSSKSIIDPFGSGNLQNVPLEARKFYRAREGYKYIGADYVQAEAVVTAYLSKDRVLIRMFEDSFGMSPTERKKNHDVHRYTASIMFGVPMDEVTSTQRSIGKILRHACNYDAGPKVIGNELGIEMAEARKLRELYFLKNPHLRAWHSRIQTQLRRNRTLVNAFGRRRRFLQRWGDELFRSAYSYIPQSTVGDLLNKSMVSFYNQHGRRYNVCIQLHDAFYIEVPEKEVEQAIHMLRDCMIRTVIIDMDEMTIDVDFKVGPSWGEMEELDRSWTDECHNDC